MNVKMVLKRNIEGGLSFQLILQKRIFTKSFSRIVICCATLEKKYSESETKNTT